MAAQRCIEAGNPRLHGSWSRWNPSRDTTAKCLDGSLRGSAAFFAPHNCSLWRLRSLAAFASCCSAPLMQYQHEALVAGYAAPPCRCAAKSTCRSHPRPHRRRGRREAERRARIMRQNRHEADSLTAPTWRADCPLPPPQPFAYQRGGAHRVPGRAICRCRLSRSGGRQRWLWSRRSPGTAFGGDREAAIDTVHAGVRAGPLPAVEEPRGRGCSGERRHRSTSLVRANIAATSGRCRPLTRPRAREPHRRLVQPSLEALATTTRRAAHWCCRPLATGVTAQGPRGFRTRQQEWHRCRRQGRGQPTPCGPTARTSCPVRDR